MTKLLGINTVDNLMHPIFKDDDDHYVFQVMVSEDILDPQDFNHVGATYYVQSNSIDNVMDYLLNYQEVVECDIQLIRRVLIC